MKVMNGKEGTKRKEKNLKWLSTLRHLIELDQSTMINHGNFIRLNYHVKKNHQTFRSQLRSLRPSMIGVEVPMNWWSGKPRGVLPGDLRSYSNNNNNNNPKLKESEDVDKSVSKDLRFHVKFQGLGGFFTGVIQCWLLCV